jgi:hypothetical protein
MLVNRQTGQQQKIKTGFSFCFQTSFLVVQMTGGDDVFSYHIQISRYQIQATSWTFYSSSSTIFLFTTSAFTSDDDESVYKSIIDRSLSLLLLVHIDEEWNHTNKMAISTSTFFSFFVFSILLPTVHGLVIEEPSAIRSEFQSTLCLFLSLIPRTWHDINLSLNKKY